MARFIVPKECWKRVCLLCALSPMLCGLTIGCAKKSERENAQAGKMVIAPGTNSPNTTAPQVNALQGTPAPPVPGVDGGPP